LFNLWKVGDKYEMEHFKSLCVEACVVGVNERNVVGVLNRAGKMESERLKVFCMDFILQRWERLKENVKKNLEPLLKEELERIRRDNEL